MTANFFSGKSFDISVEVVAKTVKMLISTEQLDKFLAYCEDKKVVVTVPAETANILKQFLDTNSVADPLAVSIVGTRQEDCNDYQCPHIHRG